MNRSSSFRTRHFLVLDRCREGAYQYLGVRDRPKSLEVILIHQVGKKRNTRVVAKISKSALDFHALGYNGSSGGDITVKIDREAAAGILTLASRLRAGNHGEILS